MSAVDRKALRKAVAYRDEIAISIGDTIDNPYDEAEIMGALDSLLAAARSVLEGEAIKYCPVHKHMSSGNTNLDIEFSRLQPEPCRMVRVVVVPIEGE